MESLPTLDQLASDFEDAARARRPDLTDWNEGSTLDALRYAAALLAHEIQQGGVTQVRTLFFSTAEGEDLDALVADRFGGLVARQVETAASGQVLFARPGPGAAITIPQGTEVYASTAPTLRFVTRAAVSLGTGDSEVAATVDCTTTGREGNLDADKIDTLAVSSLDDPAVGVSQPERLAGGGPAETDAQLRARVRDYYQSLQRGTLAALRQAALAVPGVRVAIVSEAHAAPEEGGYVLVIVGDVDGASNTTLEEAAAAALEDYRAAGVFVQVQGTSPTAIAIEVAVTLTDAAALGLVTTAIQEALAAYGASLGAGDTLYVSQLERVAINVSSADAGGYIKDATVAAIHYEDPFLGPIVTTADLTVHELLVPRIAAQDVSVAGVG